VLPATASANPSCGANIEHNTTLTADLDCQGYGPAIGAGVSNVTLDLGGHTLSGSGLIGIGVGEASNVTIENGTVTGFENGINVGRSSVTIKRVTLIRNGEGVSLFHTEALLIRDRIERNSVGGIFSDGFSTITLDHTKVKHNG
jgi:hypothetical protein